MARLAPSKSFRSATALAAAALATLAGCSALGDALGTPTARIASVGLQDLQLDGVTMLFDVEIENPYSVALPLVNLGYALASGGKSFLEGRAKLDGSVPAGGKRTIQVPAKLNFAGVLSALTGLKPGAVFPYAAQLDLSVDAPVVGRIGLPLETSGELPIPALPKLEMPRIDVEKFGLTGVNAVLQFGIENPNQFPISLDVFDYALKLGGNPVASSKVRDGSKIAANGTGKLRIPIEISTLDVGRGVLDLLRGNSAVYDVSGSMQLGTPFGAMPSPIKAAGNALIRN
ncbi:MAG TPA: LEA type 2 family protein [Planctomycetota bacterium]